jgi:hypothetical protein
VKFCRRFNNGISNELYRGASNSIVRGKVCVERRVPSLIGPCPHSRYLRKCKLCRCVVNSDLDVARSFRWFYLLRAWKERVDYATQSLSARGRSGAKMWGTRLSCGTCGVQLQHPQWRNTCILAFVLTGLSWERDCLTVTRPSSRVGRGYFTRCWWSKLSLIFGMAHTWENISRVMCTWWWYWVCAI